MKYIRGAHRPLASLALACATLLGATWAPPAHALRPHDGTDADVAEPGALQIEAGVGRIRQGTDRSFYAPDFAATFGLDGDTEVALGGRLTRQLGDSAGPYRTSLSDTELAVKHLLRKGSLQDGGSGLSVALECALALPEVHGEHGYGGGCTTAVSNRWDALTLHLNGGLARTRVHTTVRTLGLIAEGPDDWTLRPALELVAERETGGGWSNSALIGATYKVSDELSFDAGVRHARTGDGSLNELRLGLTWNLRWKNAKD